VQVNVTLDRNCLIDIEENRQPRAAVQKLVHANGQHLRLQVPGIGASELLPGGLRPDSFSRFRDWLATLGLASVEILKPMAYYDVGYYDWCVDADEAMQALEKRIHDVLFPNVLFDYPTFCAARGIDPNQLPANAKWLNAKCDVQSVWCHIQAGGGIFVTSDANFHKCTKKSVLEGMGVGRIATPAEAVSRLGL
jgi:hypothetical protein